MSRIRALNLIIYLQKGTNYISTEDEIEYTSNRPSSYYHCELQSNIIRSIGCSFVSEKCLRSISNDVPNRYNHIWQTLTFNTNHCRVRACLDRCRCFEALMLLTRRKCIDVPMCEYSPTETSAHIHRNSFKLSIYG